jgi:hypothetical protein
VDGLMPLNPSENPEPQLTMCTEIFTKTLHFRNITAMSCPTDPDRICSRFFYN